MVSFVLVERIHVFLFLRFLAFKLASIIITKNQFFKMSDHYFKCAKEKGCVGLKADMKGFHKCARDNECLKLKMRKRTRKEKIADIVEDAVKHKPELIDCSSRIRQK